MEPTAKPAMSLRDLSLATTGAAQVSIIIPNLRGDDRKLYDASIDLPELFTSAGTVHKELGYVTSGFDFEERFTVFAKDVALEGRPIAR